VALGIFAPLISRAATRGWPQNILLANQDSHSCFLCCLVFLYRYSTLSERMYKYDDIWKEEGRVIKHRDCTNISIILREFLLQWGQWVFNILGLWPSTDCHTGTIFNVVQNIPRPPCKWRQWAPLKGWHAKFYTISDPKIPEYILLCQFRSERSTLAIPFTKVTVR